MKMRTLSHNKVVSTVSTSVPIDTSVVVGEKAFTDSSKISNPGGDAESIKRTEHPTVQGFFPPDTRDRSGDAGHSTPIPPSEKLGSSRFHPSFDMMNEHHNEGITLEEFSVAWSKAIKDRFKQLDRNGDGVSGKEKRDTNLTSEGGPPRSQWDPPA